MADPLSIVTGIVGLISSTNKLLRLAQQHYRLSADFQHLQIAIHDFRDVLRTLEYSTVVEDSSTAVRVELAQCLAKSDSTIRSLMSEIPQRRSIDHISTFISTLKKLQLTFACLLSSSTNRRVGESVPTSSIPAQVEESTARAVTVTFNWDSRHPSTYLPPPNEGKTATPTPTLDPSETYTAIPTTCRRASPQRRPSYTGNSPGKHHQVQYFEKDTIASMEGPTPISMSPNRWRNLYLDVILLMIAVVGAVIMTQWKDFQVPKCTLERTCGRGNIILDTPGGLPIQEPTHIGTACVLGALKSGLASPATLIVSATATSLALSTWYSLHWGEKYQDYIIIGTVGAGTIIGLLAELDTIDVLLQILPWCGIAAMLLSSYGLRPIEGGYYER